MKVDDATRAGWFGRGPCDLSGARPAEVLKRLRACNATSANHGPFPWRPEIPRAALSAARQSTALSEAQLRISSNFIDAAKDAAEITGHVLFSPPARASERALILHNLLEDTAQGLPLRRIPRRQRRGARAIETLDDGGISPPISRTSTLELGEALILPWADSRRSWVNDPAARPLACAAKALDMPEPGFFSGCVAVSQS